MSILAHFTTSCESSRLFKFLSAKPEFSDGLICIWKMVLYLPIITTHFLSLFAGASVQCYVQRHCSTMAYFISSLVQHPTLSSPLCFSQYCTVGCVLTSYKNVSRPRPLKFNSFLWQVFSMRIAYEFVETRLQDNLKVDVMFYSKSASLLTVGNSP